MVLSPRFSLSNPLRRAKHWPCALELLMLMAQVGLERDDVAFNTVALAFRWDERMVNTGEEW